MVYPRVIPLLLLQGSSLVKTTKFRYPQYVGDPLNVVRIFNKKQVDEMIVIDIDASRFGNSPNYDLLEQLAGECFMPLSYGGGIHSIEQARRIFSIGFEKIVVQSGVLLNFNFLSQLVSVFGSQSITVSVDIGYSMFSKPRVICKGRTLSHNYLDFFSSIVQLLPGELFVQVINLDGTMNGPNFDLFSSLSDISSVPLVAASGVSSLDDIRRLFAVGVDAVAAGSFFIYSGQYKAVLITYPKEYDIKSLK